MSKYRRATPVLPVLFTLLWASIVQAQPGKAGAMARLRTIVPDAATGASAAISVADLPLLHTGQLLPLDQAGRAIHPGDAAEQFDHLLRQVRIVVTNNSLDDVAKLNFYVTSDAVAAVVAGKLAATFPGPHRPAVSMVVTALSPQGVSIAVDVVAVSSHAATNVASLGTATILPAGGRLYVSGQAERAETLREGTRKTLESLTATLTHCGRANTDIVQLKCFFRPMSSVAEVREEISRYFAPLPPPPVSFVEWKNASPPIEIELVAWGGPANKEPQEPLEFLTPAGLTASPVFSRVARIHRGGTIYFGDLFALPGRATEAQAQEPFERLMRLLPEAGSDMKHLAKATYYVTDDEVSKAHNTIRPKYYDAARPPAASKAIVESTGRPGVRYSMDMIAVPAERGGQN